MKRKVSTYEQLMEAAKDVLKKKKISYKRLADELDLSESSVKRLMNAQDGHLSKLEAICGVCNIKVSDLFELIETSSDEEFFTNDMQENYFLKYPGALQFLVELREYGHSVEQIKEHYFLTDASVNKYLNGLEKIGLIEVHPGNNIKFAFDGIFSISDQGKLAQKLLRSAMDSIVDFTLEHMAAGPKEKGINFTMKTGELLFTKDSGKEVFKRIGELNELMGKLCSRDMRLYRRSELISFQYVTALIPQRMLKDQIPNF